MKLTAKKDFTSNGSYYFANDEIDIKELGTIEVIRRLNEKGFIKPLTLKELIEIEKELKQETRKIKKEVE